MITAISILLNAAAAALTRRGEESLGDYLALAALLIRSGDDARDELAALTSEIEAMVEEGRDPTPEERSSVAERRRALSNRLQGRPAEGGGGGAPEGATGEASDEPAPWNDEGESPEPAA